MPQSKAVAPVTNGAAIDVPDIYPYSLFFTLDKIIYPGAAMSIYSPQLENVVRSNPFLLFIVAATVNALFKISSVETSNSLATEETFFSFMALNPPLYFAL